MHLSNISRLALYNSTGGEGGGGGGGGGGTPPATPPADPPAPNYAELAKALDPKLVEHLTTSAVESFKGTLPKVPEKFDGLKLPEKAILPDAVLERTASIARELGLTSNEHAQKLVDFTHGEAAKLIEQIAADHRPGGAAYEAQAAAYQREALAAPDLGNGKPEVLQAHVARVTAFTQKYFPEPVRKLLTEHGIGNHPDFFRAVLKLANAAKEDGFEGGDSSKGGGKKSLAERIYSKPSPEGATS